MQEQLNTIWAEVIDVWEYGFLGVDIGRILTAIGIFLVFLFIRGLFTKYVLNKLHDFTDGTKTTIDDRIVDALSPPIRFIPILLGVFAVEHYLGMNEDYAAFFAPLNRSLIAFTIFWILHRATKPLSDGFRPLEKLLSPLMASWLFRIARVLIVFIGGAVILEIWGIAVAPLLAGLGIFGAAVALGAQDLFKNLIGGITIIAEKRFEPGNWIKVDGVVEGIVERINFRSTLIRRFDKAPVHVPNSALSDAVVTNFSRMTHRRIKWDIGVTYDTTREQLEQIRNQINDYLTDSDAIAKGPGTIILVNIDRFDASAINIFVYCLTVTTDWAEYMNVKERVAYKIKEIVEGAGTSFAFPSQSIYVESLPQGNVEDTPEVFVPPKNKAS